MFGFGLRIGSGSASPVGAKTDFDIQPYAGTATIDGASYASWADLLASGRVTFTRASVQWARDVAGVYTSFSSGNAAITDRGLALAPAATNLILDSVDFSTANWTRTACSVTGGQDDVFGAGGTTGTLVTESGSGALLSPVATMAVTSVTSRQATFIMARGNTDWVCLTMSNAAFSNRARFWVNLATGAVGATPAQAGTNWVATSCTTVQLATVNTVTWWMITLTYQSGTSSVVCALQTCTGDLATTRANVGSGAGVGSTFKICHAQVENSATATSPIRTSGTALTRAAGALTIRARAGTYDLTYTLTDTTTVAAAGTNVPFVASTALTQPVTRIQGTAL